MKSNWVYIVDSQKIEIDKNKTNEEIWIEYIEAKIKQWKEHDAEKIAEMLRNC